MRRVCCRASCLVLGDDGKFHCLEGFFCLCGRILLASDGLPSTRGLRCARAGGRRALVYCDSGAVLVIEGRQGRGYGKQSTRSLQVDNAYHGFLVVIFFTNDPGLLFEHSLS